MTRIDIKGIPGAEGFAIAVIVMWICFGCTVGATAWQARYPLPVSYARAVPPPEPAKPADRLPVHLVPTITYRLDPPAVKTETARYTPMPWTCAEIRAYARTHTEAEMHAKAVEHKLTPQQRAIAKACIQGKRTDYRDRRCDGPARYEAMREGANCS